jgi:hypothetical protein
MKKHLLNKFHFVKLSCLMVLGLLGISQSSLGQSAYGELRGALTLIEFEQDSFWEFNITSAKVKFYSEDNTQVRFTRPEFGGEFYFKKLAPGNYYFVIQFTQYKNDTSLVYTVSPDILTRMNGITFVDNLFNTKKPTTVYPYPGQAMDDGFLSSPKGHPQGASAINAEVYEALYNAVLQNPGVFMDPRMVQLQIRPSF